MNEITHLPETDWFRGDVKPTINGVYKRTVFITSAVQYSRWEDGCWYEGETPITDLEADHALAFFRASAAQRKSTFQFASAWCGLRERCVLKPTSGNNVVTLREFRSPGKSSWRGTVDSSDGSAT